MSVGCLSPSVLLLTTPYRPSLILGVGSHCDVDSIWSQPMPLLAAPGSPQGSELNFPWVKVTLRSLRESIYTSHIMGSWLDRQSSLVVACLVSLGRLQPQVPRYQAQQYL